MAGEDGGMFLGGGVPGAGQAAELALLSAAGRAWVAGEAAGGGRGDQRALGGQPGVLRLPADPRPAQAPRAGLRSQDGVAGDAPAWVAGDRSAPAGATGAPARGAGASGRTEPAVGLGHHGHRAWDGQKGRLAIMIDCADRMVLAWRFAKRITAEDLAELLREAVFRRFGEARTRHRGSSSSATMGRNTPRIGSGRSCGQWG